MRTPNIVNALTASFWFVPMVVVVVAVVVALGLVMLEGVWGLPAASWGPFPHDPAPDTTSRLLATIATAVATIAATTFSITIVALTLAARQYTPKMLHNYISNRGNQLVLGVLMGTFTYVLLVLRSIRSNPDFVPTLALTGALALALASISAFIYFIHHVTTALQGTSITADIEQRTLNTIKRTLANHTGAAAGPACRGGVPVPAEGSSGYVQVVEIDALVTLMADHDLVLTVERGAGRFVPSGAVLARLSPPERASQELVRNVQGHFKIGQDRTHQQDVEYGIYQLVDIAIRSLSPAFNATTTAATCIDHIGSILRHLAPMDLPARRGYERDGTVRVIAESASFSDLLNLGFDQIRTVGESHPMILIRLLEVLGELEEVTDQPERRQLLLAHVNRIAAAAERGVQAEVDREAIRQRLKEVGARLRDAGRGAALDSQFQ